MKNKTAFTFIFMIPLIFMSCYDDDCTRPSNCYSSRPETIAMEIKVTINNENPNVDVTIYSGVYEEGNVQEELTLNSSTKIISLPEGRYSATAYYKRDVDTILAIDGEHISVNYWSCEDSSGTSDSCYEVNEGKLNLTL